MAKYELINCKPVPAKLAPELRAMGFGKDIVLTSCLRNQGAVDFARRRGCQLSSQAELYNGFVQGRPGFNPANPVGQSTHELRSDGAAFRWIPRRAAIRYWMVGIDCVMKNGGSAVATVRARAAKRGWTFTLTYPGNSRETHHGNFRKEPVLNIFSPLRKGKSKGLRVRQMTGRLAYIGYLPGVSPKTGTGGFGAKVEEAVKAFQKRHHQKVDGIYGVHTHRQLLASVAHTKKSRRGAAKKRRSK